MSLTREISCILNQLEWPRGNNAELNLKQVLQHEHKSAIMKGIMRLNSGGLMTGAAGALYVQDLMSHAFPDSLSSAYVMLYQEGLWVEDRVSYFREILRRHRAPMAFTSDLVCLKRSGIFMHALGPLCVEVLVAQKSSTKLVEMLITCHELGLLTQERIDWIKTSPKLKVRSGAIFNLKNAGFLVGEKGKLYFDTIMRHKFPGDFADILIDFNKKSMPVDEYFERLSQHPSLNLIADLIKKLSDMKALNQFTCQHLLQSETPKKTYFALSALTDLGLLTENNLNTILQHLVKEKALSVLNSVASRSRSFLKRGMSQDRLEAWLSHKNILLTNKVFLDGWAVLPPELITVGLLEQLIALAERHRLDPVAGQDAVIHHIAQYIETQNARRVFNAMQTTHTASVHQSVSESAERLKIRYREGLMDRSVGQALVASLLSWKNSLQENLPKHAAAKRCLYRLMSWPLSIFTDPKSRVSIASLLMYVWRAMHDEQLRAGTLEDSYTHFIQCLYDIQRGGNFLLDGIDNNQMPDVSICPSGTFNKLMESLAGFHPDVQLVFISREGATLKFKIVVEEEAMHYLTILSQSGNVSERQQFKRFVDEIIQEEGELPIELWERMINRVSDRMFDEFASLYKDGKDSAEFTDFMATGEYVTLSAKNLACLKEILTHFVVAVVAQTSDMATRSESFMNAHGFFSSSSAHSLPDQTSSEEPANKQRCIHRGK